MFWDVLTDCLRVFKVLEVLHEIIGPQIRLENSVSRPNLLQWLVISVHSERSLVIPVPDLAGEGGTP